MPESGRSTSGEDIRQNQILDTVAHKPQQEHAARKDICALEIEASIVQGLANYGLLFAHLEYIYHEKLQETLLVSVLRSDHEQSEFDMLNYFTCISAPMFRQSPVTAVDPVPETHVTGASADPDPSGRVETSTVGDEPAVDVVVSAATLEVVDGASGSAERKLGVAVAVPEYSGHPGTPVLGAARPPPQSGTVQISSVSGS
ncbi:siderophore biosynthesis [Diaporthe amygdali]|uniref:siderophore biosynthesis n=1 Tax=Phomopsis amygdali TaxID=1214568 RepID=UPI0022FE8F0E|nr:siderophore biosynthesis [Diaporthe amygdali]KAJ0124261.1 siderophore biosynthesis [Diaporthe amygdali]